MIQHDHATFGHFSPVASSETNCGVRNERRLLVRGYWAIASESAMSKHGMFFGKNRKVLANEARARANEVSECAVHSSHEKHQFNYKT